MKQRTTGYPRPNLTFISFIFLSFIFLVLTITSFVSAVGTYPAVDPNMVLYYHFNNQSAYGENNTNVYDFSGNGNNGTIYNGPNIVLNSSYLNDGSLNMTGSNNHVLIRNVIVHNFTISVWIKLNNTSPSNSNTVLWKDNDFAIRVGYPSRKLQCFAYNGSLINTGGSIVILNDTWTNVVCSYDGTNLTGYVNGIKDGSVSLLNSTNSSSLIQIGKQSSSQSTLLNGSIDELIIYNKSLSIKEIQNLYNTYEGCFNLSSNYYVYFDKVACGGIVYKNSSVGYGAVIISGNDLTLDLNGTVLIGGDLTYTSAVYTKDHSNILIKNFTSNHYFWGIEADQTSSGLVSNITFDNFLVNSYKQSGIYLKHANHVTLSNFNINQSDMGIYLLNSSDIFIYNANISSTFTSYDGFGVGIYLGYDNNNISISNSSILYTCDGIMIRGSNNVNISNNYFQQTSFVFQMSNYSSLTCAELDPSSAIFSPELFGGWLGTPKGEPPVYNVSNISYIGTFASNNVYIKDNTFGNNVQAFLTLQGTTNVTHDLTNFWYRAFQFPTYLIDKTEVYISNNVNNLSVVGNWSNVYNYGGFFIGVTDLLYQKYVRQGNSVTYKVHKDYLYFNNLNGTEYNSSLGIVTNIMGLRVFNQSNALISYSNNSASICNGDCNITLNPNEYAYVYNNNSINSSKLWTNLLAYDPLTYEVFLSPNINSNDGYFNNSQLFNFSNNASILLDNFNLTEGINREYSPIWFSSSTSTSKTISSNLSNSVNVSVIVNVSNCNNDILFYYNGSYSYTSCSNNQATGTLNIKSGISNLILYYGNYSGSLIVNYNYTYNSNEQNGYYGGTGFILEGIMGMIINFFSLSPVIGTIMGVCILISGIVILVIYIRKLSKDKGENDTIYG